MVENFPDGITIFTLLANFIHYDDSFCHAVWLLKKHSTGEKKKSAKRIVMRHVTR